MVKSIIWQYPLITAAPGYLLVFTIHGKATDESWYGVLFWVAVVKCRRSVALLLSSGPNEGGGQPDSCPGTNLHGALRHH